MSRTPVTGTAVTAALMLAFGIAAATTTFSATDAALLRPMPFESPDRLLYLHMTRQTERDGRVLTRWTPARAAAARRAARSFDASAIYTRSSVGISGHGDAAQIEAEVISSGYLETLRVQPAFGRAFTAAEEAPGHPVAMIGDRLWRQRYNADPGVLGRSVLLTAGAIAWVRRAAPAVLASPQNNYGQIGGSRRLAWTASFSRSSCCSAA